MSYDRKTILRIDCGRCRGNGYIIDPQTKVEEPCATCGGVGMREKQVPYRAEGYDYRRDRAEIAQIFGVSDFTSRNEVDNS